MLQPSWVNSLKHAFRSRSKLDMAVPAGRHPYSQGSVQLHTILSHL
jgi:hypothetical protein